MGKRISVAGWFVFIAAILGAIFRKGPDDPETAAIKQSDFYQAYLVAMCVLVGLAAFLLVREIRKGAKAHKKLEELKRQRLR
jgi:hypothetical protein